MLLPQRSLLSQLRLMNDHIVVIESKRMQANDCLFSLMSSSLLRSLASCMGDQFLFQHYHQVALS